MARTRPPSESLLFRWRDAFCSAEGPPALTRLVLWTLSKHMNADGSSSFPGQATIAAESGLALRSVKAHLEAAERLRWIERRPRRKGGRRMGTDYVPRFPLPDGAGRAPSKAGADGAAHDRDGAAGAADGAGGAPEYFKEYITEASAKHDEGSTPAAEEVRQRRALREKWLEDYERGEGRNGARG